MRVVTRAGAVADVVDIRRWYAAQQEGLDERFREELDRTVEAIAARPMSFPTVARGVRRARIRHFPQGVFFRDEGDAVVIFAVVHGRRHPNAWRRRRE